MGKNKKKGKKAKQPVKGAQTNSGVTDGAGASFCAESEKSDNSPNMNSSLPDKDGQAAADGNSSGVSKEASASHTQVSEQGENTDKGTGQEGMKDNDSGAHKSPFEKNNESVLNFSFGNNNSPSPNDSKTPRSVAEEREYWIKMPVEEKRKHYQCKGNYLTLNDMMSWPAYYKENGYKMSKVKPKDEEVSRHHINYKVDESINSKITLFRGNITVLELDAVVNAANRFLMGGGGIDGAIHNAAGKKLMRECESLHGCETGKSKTTAGYKLPAKYVIHTVGPTDRSEKMLVSCYKTCFEEMQAYKMKTAAFCCIATGVYGYAPDKAVHVALKETRDFLEELKKKNELDKIDRIIFCLFLHSDLDLYEAWSQIYFPVVDTSKPTSPRTGADNVNQSSNLSSDPAMDTTVENVNQSINPRSDSAMDTTVETTVENVNQANSPPSDTPSDTSNSPSMDTTVDNANQSNNQFNETQTDQLSESLQKTSLSPRPADKDAASEATDKTTAEAAAEAAVTAESAAKAAVSAGAAAECTAEVTPETPTENIVTAGNDDSAETSKEISADTGNKTTGESSKLKKEEP